MQQGLVAQRIHSCGKAGSWGFQLHTQVIPPMAVEGKAPHQGQSGSSVALTAR